MSLKPHSSLVVGLPEGCPLKDKDRLLSPQLWAPTPTSTWGCRRAGRPCWSAPPRGGTQSPRCNGGLPRERRLHPRPSPAALTRRASSRWPPPWSSEIAPWTVCPAISGTPFSAGRKKQGFLWQVSETGAGPYLTQSGGRLIQGDGQQDPAARRPTFHLATLGGSHTLPLKSKDS